MWCLDVMYLPLSKYNSYQGALVGTEVITGYAWCSPLKKINSAQTYLACSELLRFCPDIKFIQSDFGPEFSGEFKNLMTFS